MSKTIKIPNSAHQELKRFIADNPNQTMEDMAGVAIISYLKEMGHKFLKPKQSYKK
ncbi:MAG: hypothetical protein V4538_17380 [Bacteroidota bacterium]